MTNENAENAENIENTEKQTALVSTLPEQHIVNSIITKRVYVAMGIGFIPIPLVDFAAITALQLEMINALCKAHGITFKQTWGRSAISSLLGGALTVGAVPLLGSLAKVIPVIGTTLGATSIIITGAASTYAVGKVFDQHFRNGGTLKNFDPEKAKAYLSEKLQEGKEYISSLKKKKNDKEKEADTDASAVA